ncbi:MAG: proline dehydrogenase transcriptional activator, partial [Candidatus Thermoplasmatota archaeon]
MSTPTISARLAALEDLGVVRGYRALVDPERPMLSSLALTPSGEDDGFLTALEVFRMKVPADLVV